MTINPKGGSEDLEEDYRTTFCQGQAVEAGFKYGHWLYGFQVCQEQPGRQEKSKESSDTGNTSNWAQNKSIIQETLQAAYGM